MRLCGPLSVFAIVLPVEGCLLDPVEASTDEQELVAVQELELHVDLVAVHFAIKDQLIWSRALEGKGCFPVLVIGVSESEDFAIDIDRGTVTGEGIVHALKGHPSGGVKDCAPPAFVVGEEWRVNLPVYRELVDVPDAVEC